MTPNIIELRTHYDSSGYVLSRRTCYVPWAVLITFSTFAFMKWTPDYPQFTNEWHRQMVYRRIKMVQVIRAGE